MEWKAGRVMLLGSAALWPGPDHWWLRKGHLWRQEVFNTFMDHEVQMKNHHMTGAGAENSFKACVWPSDTFPLFRTLNLCEFLNCSYSSWKQAQVQVRTINIHGKTRMTSSLSWQNIVGRCRPCVFWWTAARLKRWQKQMKTWCCVLYPPICLFIYDQVKWDRASSMCCCGDLMSTCLLAVPRHSDNIMSCIPLLSWLQGHKNRLSSSVDVSQSYSDSVLTKTVFF